MLLYVDDILHLLASGMGIPSGEAEAVSILLWLTYGFRFQLHKVIVHQNPIKYIGYMLHLNSPNSGEITLTIPDEKIRRIIEDLRSLRKQPRIFLSEVEKTCGKLMWMCGLLTHLKSHLVVFYGAIAYMKRHDLRSMDLSKDMKQTIDLWLHILTVDHFPKTIRVRPSIDDNRLVLASCDASLDGMGGLYLDEGPDVLVCLSAE
ncbi:hypothetical protein Pmar_PMAR010722 [Perkinsus marinus ATCC 50983]|uniref:Reverse transcriptase domain-containing protein n=1 Tax=Perkinsus marinus (strain ATCC 50983 / TXsc) TaxID=423536 RepID=C5L0F6_PERM5|nr:hypothetical protein Pmar_PMAR010722 [Perkinsus marinus ATCC 50983]EER09779.1 hypothetical protein Pmar_PMAR010722 [Perkinsus marinus ATCC 50983]|eukprot:XP_002777984.1 hypothetical protein Pmar_PMAR010722 [Perkinsus marinus ATCC 50983]